MSLPQIIIPRPSDQRGTKPYQTPGEHWEEVTERMYGSAELPQTIHHAHDKGWNRRFWSIQNANDQAAWIVSVLPGFPSNGRRKRFGFWSLFGVLVIAAEFGWLWIRTR